MSSATPDEAVPSGGAGAEDDHDVLTFREAGERLQQEIRAQEQLVESLAGSPEQEAASARLAQLVTAAQRQDTARRAAYDRSTFFGSAD